MYDNLYDDTAVWWKLEIEDMIGEIKFTSSHGGIVIARLDSLSEWEYISATDVDFALWLGSIIIRNQIKERSK